MRDALNQSDQPDSLDRPDSIEQLDSHDALDQRDLRQRELVPPDRLAVCHGIVIGVGAIGRGYARMEPGSGPRPEGAGCLVLFTRRVTGESIQSRDYMQYLQTKFGEIYGV